MPRPLRTKYTGLPSAPLHLLLVTLPLLLVQPRVARSSSMDPTDFAVLAKVQEVLQRNISALQECGIRPFFGARIVARCTNSSVTFLDFTGIPLNAPVPEPLFELSALQGLVLSGAMGTVSRNISKLQTLTLLAVRNNEWRNFSLPNEGGSLDTLLQLKFFNSSISDPLPLGMSALPRLTHLSFDTLPNVRIPVPLEWSLGLPKLADLSVSNVNLASLPRWLSGFTSLTKVFFFNNSNPVAIPPEWGGGLPSLQYLQLSPLNLVDPLPESLSNLTSLTALILSNNSFRGPIPGAWGRGFLELQRLDLSLNPLTGPIPEELGNLRNLTSFDLSSTKMMAPLGSSIFGMTSLVILNIKECQFFGPLPDLWSSLGRSLLFLDLSGNNFSGSIPRSMSALTVLVGLYIGNNSFTGSIPWEVLNIPALSTFDARNNQLSGPLVNFSDSVGSLLLSFNKLSGPLPDDYSPTSNLVSWFLDFNNVWGPIPSTISKLSQLEYLQLNKNELIGQCQDTFTRMPELRSLDLSRNLLTGPLPSPPYQIVSYTGQNPQKTDVWYYMSDNFFTGLAYPNTSACDSCTTSACDSCTTWCPQTGALAGNCLTYTGVPRVCAKDPMETSEKCNAFCGALQSGGACGGRGTCYLDPSGVPTCQCDDNLVHADVSSPGTCTALESSLAVNVSFPCFNSSSLSSLTTTGEVLLSGTSLVLGGSPDRQAASNRASVAFLHPLRLLSGSRTRCSLIPFSFSIAFLVDASSVARGNPVIFDAFLDPREGGNASSPALSYASLDTSLWVRVNASTPAFTPDQVRNLPLVVEVFRGNILVGTSAWEFWNLSSGSTLPLSLTLGYNATSYTLAVSLSHTSDGQDCAGDVAAAPSADGTLVLISVPLDTCTLLSEENGPGQGSVTVSTPFFFGIAELPLQGPSQPVVLTRLYVSTGYWFVNTTLPALNRTTGLSLATSDVLPQTGAQFIFRHLYKSYIIRPDGFAAWEYVTHRDWSEFLNPVVDQGLCGACWAYVAVQAVEAAYAIQRWGLKGTPPGPPVLDVDQLLRCTYPDRSPCEGGSPREALDYIIRLTNASTGTGGLRSAENSSLTEQASCNSSGVGSDTAGGEYGVVSYDQVSFLGWLGLMLAVDRQPVIVNIEAHAESFVNYDGSYVYRDPKCFTWNIDHTVLLVGYKLFNTRLSQDRSSRFRHPFWIIRNFWGTGWGDQGHMRMSIEGGAGICGINTLPALYPVLPSLAGGPCKANAYSDAPFQARTVGSFLEPCSGCSAPGGAGKYTCSCPRGFVVATMSDGSLTCALYDICGILEKNPCGQGACVNDGGGSYSCLCLPGYRQGVSFDLYFTCVPEAYLQAETSYTTPAPEITCYLLGLTFAISVPQLEAQNPDVLCSAPLPANTTVNVTSRMPPCTLVYSISAGDTCENVAANFGFSVPDILALNPGLDCAILPPSATLCLERNASNINVTYVCSTYYIVQPTDTCASILRLASLSLLDFYRFNPGIDCNHLLPPQPPGVPSRYEICIAADRVLRAAPCNPRTKKPPAKSYTAGPRDTCTYILGRLFGYNKAPLFKLWNGFVCQKGSLAANPGICIPKK